jgi:connector enhancer of kinase suppressor of Ras 2
VKENNGGLQLGATSMIKSNVSDMYLLAGADNSSILSGFTIDTRKKPEEIIPVPDPVVVHHEDIRSHQEANREDEEKTEKHEKLNKQSKKSLNYLHASNPNLLDFDFHSTVDFPTNNVSTCNWDHQTGMTLLDLMQKQLDEEKKDMYNKRVEQGIEKIDERTLQQKKEKPAVPPKPEKLSCPTADPHIEKIQKRTLPVTPDYGLSFKPDDKAILYTRTKEGQKLRDFGYELIHGDDAATSKAALESARNNEKLWNAKRGDRVVPISGSLKKKSGFNWMLSNDKEEISTATISGLGNSGSFRKSKNKLENFKGHSTNISAAFTYDKGLNPNVNSKVYRKNSAPNSTSIIGIPFSKLSFSSSSCKEKKLLGSPKLHRAIFGRTHSSSSSTVDHEIFSPITFPKV